MYFFACIINTFKQPFTDFQTVGLAQNIGELLVHMVKQDKKEGAVSVNCRLFQRVVSPYSQTREDQKWGKGRREEERKVSVSISC